MEGQRKKSVRIKVRVSWKTDENEGAGTLTETNGLFNYSKANFLLSSFLSDTHSTMVSPR